MTDTAKQIDEAVADIRASMMPGMPKGAMRYPALRLAVIAVKTLDRIATALEAQNAQVDTLDIDRP